MKGAKSAKKASLESVQRIEPARLGEVSDAISDVVAEPAAASAGLAHALNPRPASNPASLVRIMNTYYSNLIKGHNTRPRDIERRSPVSLRFPTDTLDEFDLRKLRMAMKIGGEYRLEQIGIRQWHRLARELRIDAPKRRSRVCAAWRNNFRTS
jgi:hypothetical protein